MILSDGSRSANYNRSWFYCDGYHLFWLTTPNKHDATSPDWSGSGWYRFLRPAGTRMSTSPTPKRRCLTQGTAWMRGAHPRSKGQTNNVTFCFNWDHSCWRSVRGKVTNCGSFYVYFLPNVPQCHNRYCAI